MAHLAPLKIALINEPAMSGASRCALDLERHLGHDHQVRYYPQPHLATAEAILADLAPWQPDVVHCHSYQSRLPYGFLAPLSHRYPTCFTVHDPRPIGTMEVACWDCDQARTCRACPLVRPRQRWLPLLNPYFLQRWEKRQVHRRAHPSLTLISPSRWLQQRLLATELRRFPSYVVPNAIDLEHFRPHPEARNRLGLPGDRPILFYAANWGGPWMLNPRKGLAYLAEAFIQRVAPAHPEVLLVVAGEKLVPNHPQVLPVGMIAQDTIPLYYSAADIYVTPTVVDNFPYTVLEAMACGAPVVASAVGGVPEQVVPGETGLLVPVGKVGDLGQALLDLLAQPERCRAMGRAGRARVEREFAMATFLQRHQEIYRGVMARFPHSPVTP